MHIICINYNYIDDRFLKQKIKNIYAKFTNENIYKFHFINQ